MRPLSFVQLSGCEGNEKTKMDDKVYDNIIYHLHSALVFLRSIGESGVSIRSKLVCMSILSLSNNCFSFTHI